MLIGFRKYGVNWLIAATSMMRIKSGPTLSSLRASETAEPPLARSPLGKAGAGS